MKLSLDIIHRHRGDKAYGCKCRIRIFDDGGSSTPVVLATDLPGGDNATVTRMAPALAADVVMQYLPHRAGKRPAFIWIEHYLAARFRDVPESLTLVTFADYNPQLYANAGALRYKLDSPQWAPYSRSQLCELIGQQLAIEYAGDSYYVGTQSTHDTVEDQRPSTNTDPGER